MPQEEHNIRQTFGLREHPSEFGLEVEMEYREPVEMEDHLEAMDYWKFVNDHSLRGYANELVSRPQVSLKNLPTALEKLDKYFKETLPVESHRASTHVHVNVGNRTLVQVLTMATMWWWLEELAIKATGPEREGNLFCLGLKEANGVTQDIVDTYAGPGRYNVFNQDNRYGALNLMSLRKFGSLEFRCMRSTKDTALLDKWVKMCYTLCEAYKEFGSPNAFMDAVFYRKPEDLLGLMVPGMVDEFRNIPDWREHLKVNVGVLTNFAYGVDWGVDMGKNREPVIIEDDFEDPYPDDYDPDPYVDEPRNNPEPPNRPWFVVADNHLAGAGGVQNEWVRVAERLMEDHEYYINEQGQVAVRPREPREV